MRHEANSGIFRSLLGVLKVKGAEAKHMAALSHRRSHQHSSHLELAGKQDYNKRQGM